MTRRVSSRHRGTRRRGCVAGRFACLSDDLGDVGGEGQRVGDTVQRDGGRLDAENDILLILRVFGELPDLGIVKLLTVVTAVGEIALRLVHRRGVFDGVHVAGLASGLRKRVIDREKNGEASNCGSEGNLSASPEALGNPINGQSIWLNAVTPMKIRHTKEPPATHTISWKLSAKRRAMSQ